MMRPETEEVPTPEVEADGYLEEVDAEARRANILSVESDGRT